MLTAEEDLEIDVVLAGAAVEDEVITSDTTFFNHYATWANPHHSIWKSDSALTNLHKYSQHLSYTKQYLHNN